MPIATHPVPAGADPADVLLRPEDLVERYDISELCRRPNFPAHLIAGVYRIPLVALRAWEAQRAAVDPEATPSTPAAIPAAAATVVPPPPGRRPRGPGRAA